MSRRSRAVPSARALVALLAVLVPLGLAVPPAVAGAADLRLPLASAAAGDLELPARYHTNPPDIGGLAASAELIAYAATAGRGEADGYGATTVRLTGSQTAQRYPGVHPGGVAGRHVLLRRVDLRQRGLEMLDAVSGARRTLSGVGDFAHVAPLADGGWVQLGSYAEVEKDLMVHGPDDALRLRLPVGPDGAFGLVADDDGAVWQTYSREGFGDVRYADFAAGTVRSLGRSRCGAALAAGVVALCDQGGIVRLRRPELTVAARHPAVASDVGDLTVTPSGTGWVESGRASQPGAATPYTVRTSAASDPARTVAVQGDLPAQYVAMEAAGDEIVLVAGRTSRSRGVYPLQPGASALGGPRDLVGPLAPEVLRLTLGRVLLAERTAADGSPDTRIVERELARGAAGVFLGPERVLTRGVALQAPASPGLVATSAQVTHDVPDLVIVDRQGTEVARRTLQARGAAVSGFRALARRQDNDEGVGTSRVLDLRPAPQSDVVVDGAGDLWGDELVWVRRDGAVLARQVGASGEDRLLRPPGLPAGVGFMREADVKVAVREGWAAWSLQPAGAPGETVLRRLDGSAELRLPEDVEELHLAGGRAGWVDRDDLEVHVLDLATGQDEVVGRRASRHLQATASMAVSEDAVAWVVDDGRTIVRPLTVPPAPARLLGLMAPRRFSPTTGLVVRADATRPLDRVELVVRDGSGREVARRTGSALGGAVRLAWHGQLPDGTRAPDGAYTWTLSAAELPVRNGTAVLDSVTPSLSLDAPVLFSDRSTTPRARLTWSTNDPTARFEIVRQGRVPTADPTAAWQWSAPFAWRRGATSGTAVYERNQPVAQPDPGATLRFRVSVRDEAGNSRTVIRDLLVPHDDRSALLRWSSGWSRTSATSAWAGTRTETATAGRTLTTRTLTNRVVIVGARCPACGRFTVHVDGRLLRTVDTRGADAARQRLVDISLPGAPTAHTVHVRTEGTAGRPRIVLDAVGLVR